MSDIFISYSRRDKDFVRALHAALNQNGRDTWVDWEDIPLTADWLQEIKSAIEAAHTFIFIISPDSVASEVCRQEIEHAVRYNKRLVPVLHRAVPDEAVHPMLRSHNYIFFRPEDAFDNTFAALLNAIDTDLSHVRQHTRLLVRALEWDGHERNDSFVLRGSDLSEGERWLLESSSKNPEPTDLHRQYIAASRFAAIARQRVTIGGLIAGIVIALVLAAFAFYQSNIATQEAASRATAEAVAVTQQNVAEANAAAAQTESANRATAESLAVTQQNIAEANAAAAQAAEATAQRNAIEAQAQAWAAAAQLALNQNDYTLALALALEAAGVENPPPAAQRALADAAYAPGETRNLKPSETDILNTLDVASDGDRVITAGIDGSVNLWSLSGGVVLRRLEGAIGNLHVAVFSPDGSQVAVGSCLPDVEDEFFCPAEVIVWDTESGDVLRRWEVGGGRVDALDFSPDGSRIAAGTNDRQVIVWEADSGAELWRTQGNYQFIVALAFTPDGDDLLTAGNSGMDLWDAETGALKRGFGGSINQIRSLAISPDGLTAFTGSNEMSLILWDLRTGGEIRRFLGHTAEVLSVAYSPDGTQAVSSGGSINGADQSIIVWDVAAGSMLRRIRPDLGSVSGDISHSFDIIAARFTPDGKRVLGGIQDGTLRLWDMQNGAIIRRLEAHTFGINSIALSPDGRYLASGSMDFPTTLTGDLEGPGELFLWDTFSGERLRTFEGHEAPVMGIAFTPDGQTLISIDKRGIVLSWEVTTGALRQELGQHDAEIAHLALTPDGRYAISSATDGTVVIWDVKAGREARRIQAHGSYVDALAVTPDSRYFLTGGLPESGVELSLWDVETGELVRQFETPTEVIDSLAVSPDGKTALAGNFDGSLQLYDIASGNRVGERFVGHEGGSLNSVLAVAFTADGRYIVSGASDNTVIVWDAASGQPLRRLRGHADWVDALVISLDGRSIFAADEDGSIIQWRLDNLHELTAWAHANRIIHELTCNERAQYAIEPTCTEGQRYPTRTPYPTLSPTPTFTPTPTIDLTQVTATPSFTPTFTPSPSPTATPTITPTTTPTPAGDAAIPFSELESRVAALDLPFTPLLPRGELPEGLFLYNVGTRVPAEEDRPIMSGDLGLTLTFSTDQNYTTDTRRDVLGVYQAISPFADVQAWGDASDFMLFGNYVTFAGRDAVRYDIEPGSGFLIFVVDDLYVLFLYDKIDDAMLEAVVELFIPPA